MEIHLQPEIFDIVKEKTKDVEVRLNDEKRKKLREGDYLIFLKRPEEKERLKVQIKKLVYFHSFEEVTEYYDMKRIYLESTTKEEYLDIMKQFYNEEHVKKYGVVAIEFEQV